MIKNEANSLRKLQKHYLIKINDVKSGEYNNTFQELKKEYGYNLKHLEAMNELYSSTKIYK